MEEDLLIELRENGCLQVFLKINDSNLYKQFNVNRWSGRQFIKEQNDGEHHAIVAQTIVKVCEHYDKQLTFEQKYKALALGSIHDLGEIETNDISHVFKQKHPDIKKKLEELEDEIISSIPGYETIYTEAINDPVTEAIFKIGDNIDCYLYTGREIELGTKNKELIQIHKDSGKRVSQWIERLDNLINNKEAKHVEDH